VLLESSALDLMNRIMICALLGCESNFSISPSYCFLMLIKADIIRSKDIKDKSVILSCISTHISLFAHFLLCFILLE
jgi:hypothetical protein